ncbi:MAG: hypothetical protein K0U54_04830 [Bacteroidetes bacterium]|nr:hypothetical protein [Bacteroidota bacterium]
MKPTKMIIYFLIAFVLLGIQKQINAQDIAPSVTNGNAGYEESNKPLRIGLKVGLPSVYSINLEYVTPLLDQRVAFALDYLPIGYSNEDLSLKLRNFEIGSNVYLNDTGKGLYGAISYFKFNTSADVNDVDFDNGTFGPGETSLKFGTFNVKLGAKLGRTFYFRIEVGYGFGKLPSELVITSTEGIGTTTEPIEDISVLGKSGLPVFNFGFGIGFL